LDEEGTYTGYDLTNRSMFQILDNITKCKSHIFEEKIAMPYHNVVHV